MKFEDEILTELRKQFQSAQTISDYDKLDKTLVHLIKNLQELRDECNAEIDFLIEDEETQQWIILD